MAGWTALLLWADRQPLNRRAVLPLTVVPVIAGLIANDAHAVRAGFLSATGVRMVRGLQLGLVALFGYSYVKGEQAATRHWETSHDPWWLKGSRARVNRWRPSIARPLAPPGKPGVGTVGSRRPVSRRSDA
jgi:hypothetical protein